MQCIGTKKEFFHEYFCFGMPKVFSLIQFYDLLQTEMRQWFYSIQLRKHLKMFVDSNCKYSILNRIFKCPLCNRSIDLFFLEKYEITIALIVQT